MIGPEQPIKYLGILGYSNHGKSTYMLSLVYNQMLSGMKILLAIKEGSVQDTWEKLTWMHASQFPEFSLPTLRYWRLDGPKVSVEQQTQLKVVMDDIRSRSNKPGFGSIEVIQATTWAQVESKVNASTYDVLAIDYLSQLDVEGNLHDGVKLNFRKAQTLTQTYNDGKGLVLITPLQANKAGLARADEQEGADWGVLDPSAVEMYTDALRDMDLVISVWSKDHLRQHNFAKISCVKSRGEFFPTHYVATHERYRLMHDRSLTHNDVTLLDAGGAPEALKRTRLVENFRPIP